MFQKSYFKLLLLVLSVFIINSQASATLTRAGGMGIAPSNSSYVNNYSWVVNGLESRMYENPAYANDAKNIIFFEYDGAVSGGTEDYLGGITMSPISNLTIGLFSGLPVAGSIGVLNDTTSFAQQGDYTSGGAVTSESILNGVIADFDDVNLAIISSYDLDFLVIGLSFSYGTMFQNGEFTKTLDPANDTYVDNYNLSSSVIQAGLGGKMKLSSTMDVDLSTNMIMYGNKNTYDYKNDVNSSTGEGTYEADGSMDISVASRFSMLLGIHKLHARVALDMQNRSTTGTSSERSNFDPYTVTIHNETFERKGLNFSVGVADEIKFSKDALIFAGINFIRNSSEINYNGNGKIENYTGTTLTSTTNSYSTDPRAYTESNMQVTYLMGMEVKFLDNWKGRFGVAHNILFNQATEDTNETVNGGTGTVTDTIKNTTGVSNPSDTNVSIGLSYKMKNFTIDWIGNVDLFRDGPAIISGQNNNISTALAVTFNFDSLMSGNSSSTEEPAESKKKLR